jgi:hypothetical protein
MDTVVKSAFQQKWRKENPQLAGHPDVKRLEDLIKPVLDDYMTQAQEEKQRRESAASQTSQAPPDISQSFEGMPTSFEIQDLPQPSGGDVGALHWNNDENVANPPALLEELTGSDVTQPSDRPPPSPFRMEEADKFGNFSSQFDDEDSYMSGTGDPQSMGFQSHLADFQADNGFMDESTPRPNVANSVAHDSSSDDEKLIQKLQKRGYVVARPGEGSSVSADKTVANSHKADGFETCHECQGEKKFRGRPSDMRKHQKRHTRPYGCTVPGCDRKFGSKSDWRRHENSQHFKYKYYRCPDCKKDIYQSDHFEKHLSKHRPVTRVEMESIIVEVRRVRPVFQNEFYCGFCEATIAVEKESDGCTERFDHIDQHFMGRPPREKVGIDQWKSSPEYEKMIAELGTSEQAASTPQAEQPEDVHQQQPSQPTRSERVTRRSAAKSAIRECCICNLSQGSEVGGQRCSMPECHHEFCGSCKIYRLAFQDPSSENTTVRTP